MHGKPHLKLFQIILRTNVFNQLLKALSKNNVDLIILSLMAIKLKTKVALGGIFIICAAYPGRCIELLLL